MNRFAIIFVVALAIIASNVQAGGDKKNYDDAIGEVKCNKGFSKFYASLIRYCITNDETTHECQKTKYYTLSLSYLKSACNEFKNLCTKEFNSKKAKKSKSETDEEIAFKTLDEVTTRLFTEFEKTLTGEDNQRAKYVLKEKFTTDPLKFFLGLSIRRSDLEDDIQAIERTFKRVSRKEALLRTYLLEGNEPADVPERFDAIFGTMSRMTSLESSASLE
ncbi:uncharacterized protein LOC116344231 [Contarinia nasturtii]|uniref:uncharacterized protein LOC116344231 n=1 Tax=Contarinia nasturtii TaxID=265458 RepID=UPI0012D3BC7F|nr:uncharacterized protein LOC116344231 [Contarinia nasturtii]